MTRHLPNLITGTRLILAPYLVWLLMQDRFVDALLLFAILGASDALDGYLAKHYRWESLLGAYLDPLADKIMLISAYLTLAWKGMVPGWLAFMVVGRDVIILGGALAYHWVTRELKMDPSVISKANTFFQIVLVLAVIQNEITSLPSGLVQMLIWLTLCTTLASGADYVWQSSRRLAQGN